MFLLDPLLIAFLHFLTHLEFNCGSIFSENPLKISFPFDTYSYEHDLCLEEIEFEAIFFVGEVLEELYITT